MRKAESYYAITYRTFSAMQGWELVALFGACVVYVAMATYRLDRPGLYYDEIIFVGPAAGERPYRLLFGLPIMVFPYIGALKSWIFTPIFALFGVSNVSIRLPSILISCGTLLIGFAVTRKVWGPFWALAFTGACVLHPGFLFLTRVDLGPIALMLFFKATAVYLLFRWLDSSAKMNWWLAGVCILGFFDKFNFIWLPLALVVATAIVYSRVLTAKISHFSRQEILIIGGVALAITLLGLRIIWPFLQAPDFAQIWPRVSDIWNVYTGTATGAATASLWFKTSPHVPTWMGAGVLSVTALSFTLFLLAHTGSGAKRLAISLAGVDQAALRFFLWAVLMFGIIFVEIVLTPQARGPHHVIMLFPFDLLACFGAAFLLASSISKRWRTATIAAELCLFLLWAGSNMRSIELHLSRFDNADAFRGVWSPNIESLTQFLDTAGENVGAIYCVDWGLGYQLQALCRPSIAHKVRDYWPVFLSWSENGPHAAAGLFQVFPKSAHAMYVSFTPDNCTFPRALSNFEAMRAKAGGSTVRIELASPALTSTYQVFDKPAEHLPDDRAKR